MPAPPPPSPLPAPVRPLSPPARALLAALHVLPLALVSRIAGRVAGLRLPAPLARGVIRAFGRAVGVDFAEVGEPAARFRSLQEFFTRSLAAGVRPIDAAPDAFVSPCDGAFGACGRVEAGTLLQVKGRRYALAELLGSAQDAGAFDGGSFATLYLSPRDYHRFHAPCAVRATRLRRLPGALFPVNRIGVEGVEALFARNERLCAFFALDGSEREALCIAAVGATMVGKVRVSFDDLATNEPGAGVVTREYGADGPRLAKGEEWGRFEFGSTLVLVAAPGVLALEARAPHTPVRLGERIGTLAPPRS